LQASHTATLSLVRLRRFEKEFLTPGAYYGHRSGPNWILWHSGAIL